MRVDFVVVVGFRGIGPQWPISLPRPNLDPISISADTYAGFGQTQKDRGGILICVCMSACSCELTMCVCVGSGAGQRT